MNLKHYSLKALYNLLRNLNKRKDKERLTLSKEVVKEIRKRTPRD